MEKRDYPLDSTGEKKTPKQQPKGKVYAPLQSAAFPVTAGEVPRASESSQRALQHVPSSPLGHCDFLTENQIKDVSFSELFPEKPQPKHY